MSNNASPRHFYPPRRKFGVVDRRWKMQRSAEATYERVQRGKGCHKTQQASVNIREINQCRRTNKAVHNSHKTIFGHVTNDNGEGRAACDEANDLKSITAVLSSAVQDEQDFLRPLPPPSRPVRSYILVRKYISNNHELSQKYHFNLVTT